MVCYNSGETVYTNGELHKQFYYVLQLELLGADKPIKKAAVNMRVAMSPGGATTQVSGDNDDDDDSVEVENDVEDAL
jgi:hypothetical protein